jgi:hypothetical protein
VNAPAAEVRARTWRSPGAVAFVVASGVLAGLALSVAPGHAPRTSGQIELRMAVESLAVDGDLAYEARDAERFRSAFGAGALAGFRLAAATARPASRASERVGAPAHDERRAPPLHAPWLWSRLAAAARAAGGWPAVFLLQAALVIAGGALVWRAGRFRLGGAGAARLAFVLVFTTAAGFAALELVPETLPFAAAAAAGALVWGRGRGPVTEPSQVYQGDLDERSGAWRWPLAGAAFALVACASPAWLPLAWPLVAAAPAGRRLARGALLLVVAAAVFAGLVLVGTWPWPPLELWYDPRLLGWAAVGLLAGRHVGVATWYLAAAVGFVLPAREEGRRFVPVALLLALFVAVVTSPFDLAGDSGALANAWFLPALALAGFLPARVPAPASLAALGLASFALVAPGWLAALDLDARSWARPVALVRAWLPEDTTLRAPAEVAAIERAGIVLRGTPPAVFAGADGRLRLAQASAALVVESAAPLASLRLELGGAAPADLTVRGAVAGDLVLRPDGEVALDVALGRPWRRHPTWRSPRGTYLYRFTLALPRAPAAPVPFDFSLARPLAAGEEAR